MHAVTPNQTGLYVHLCCTLLAGDIGARSINNVYRFHGTPPLLQLNACYWYLVYYFQYLDQTEYKLSMINSLKYEIDYYYYYYYYYY